MPRPNATMADVGADVIATLVRYELLGPRDIDRALDLCGLDRDQLKAGIARRRGAGWDSLRLGRENTRGTYPSPEPTRRRSTGRRQTTPRAQPRKRPPTNQRKQRPSPDGNGIELWCTGDGDGKEAHWAPEQDFIVRSDRPHLRVSKCDHHRKTYQRAHRSVAMAAREAISEAGLRLVLDDDSNLIGIECKACGQPFVPGDEVHGVATLEHAHCAGGDQ